jgi:hypothetical protein
MQAIITEINEKIGSASVVSQECKTVVSQYGQQILHLLQMVLSKVMHCAVPVRWLWYGCSKTKVCLTDFLYRVFLYHLVQHLFIMICACPH